MILGRLQILVPESPKKDMSRDDSKDLIQQGQKKNYEGSVWGYLPFLGIVDFKFAHSHRFALFCGRSVGFRWQVRAAR